MAAEEKKTEKKTDDTPATGGFSLRIGGRNRERVCLAIQERFFTAANRSVSAVNALYTSPASRTRVAALTDAKANAEGADAKEANAGREDHELLGGGESSIVDILTNSACAENSFLLQAMSTLNTETTTFFTRVWQMLKGSKERTMRYTLQDTTTELSFRMVEDTEFFSLLGRLLTDQISQDAFKTSFIDHLSTSSINTKLVPYATTISRLVCQLLINCLRSRNSWRTDAEPLAIVLVCIALTMERVVSSEANPQHFLELITLLGWISDILVVPELDGDISDEIQEVLQAIVQKTQEFEVEQEGGGIVIVQQTLLGRFTEEYFRALWMSTAREGLYRSRNCLLSASDTVVRMLYHLVKGPEINDKTTTVKGDATTDQMKAELSRMPILGPQFRSIAINRNNLKEGPLANQSSLDTAHGCGASEEVVFCPPETAIDDTTFIQQELGRFTLALMKADPASFAGNFLLKMLRLYQETLPQESRVPLRSAHASRTRPLDTKVDDLVRNLLTILVGLSYTKHSQEILDLVLHFQLLVGLWGTFNDPIRREEFMKILRDIEDIQITRLSLIDSLQQDLKSIILALKSRFNSIPSLREKFRRFGIYSTRNLSISEFTKQLSSGFAKAIVELKVNIRILRAVITLVGQVEASAMTRCLEDMRTVLSKLVLPITEGKAVPANARLSLHTQAVLSQIFDPSSSRLRLGASPMSSVPELPGDEYTKARSGTTIATRAHSKLPIILDDPQRKRGSIMRRSRTKTDHSTTEALLNSNFPDKSWPLFFSILKAEALVYFGRRVVNKWFRPMKPGRQEQAFEEDHFLSSLLPFCTLRLEEGNEVFDVIKSAACWRGGIIQRKKLVTNAAKFSQEILNKLVVYGESLMLKRYPFRYQLLEYFLMKPMGDNPSELLASESKNPLVELKTKIGNMTFSRGLNVPKYREKLLQVFKEEIFKHWAIRQSMQRAIAFYKGVAISHGDDVEGGENKAIFPGSAAQLQAEADRRDETAVAEELHKRGQEEKHSLVLYFRYPLSVLIEGAGLMENRDDLSFHTSGAEIGVIDMFVGWAYYLLADLAKTDYELNVNGLTLELEKLRERRGNVETLLSDEALQAARRKLNEQIEVFEKKLKAAIEAAENKEADSKSEPEDDASSAHMKEERADREESLRGGAGAPLTEDRGHGEVPVDADDEPHRSDTRPPVDLAGELQEELRQEIAHRENLQEELKRKQEQLEALKNERGGAGGWSAQELRQFDRRQRELEGGIEQFNRALVTRDQVIHVLTERQDAVAVNAQAGGAGAGAGARDDESDNDESTASDDKKQDVVANNHLSAGLPVAARPRVSSGGGVNIGGLGRNPDSNPGSSLQRRHTSAGAPLPIPASGEGGVSYSYRRPFITGILNKESGSLIQFLPTLTDELYQQQKLENVGFLLQLSETDPDDQEVLKARIRETLQLPIAEQSPEAEQGLDPEEFQNAARKNQASRQRSRIRIFRAIEDALKASSYNLSTIPDSQRKEFVVHLVRFLDFYRLFENKEEVKVYLRALLGLGDFSEGSLSLRQLVQYLSTQLCLEEKIPPALRGEPRIVTSPRGRGYLGGTLLRRGRSFALTPPRSVARSFAKKLRKKRTPPFEVSIGKGSTLHSSSDSKSDSGGITVVTTMPTSEIELLLEEIIPHKELCYVAPSAGIETSLGIDMKSVKGSKQNRRKVWNQHNEKLQKLWNIVEKYIIPAQGDAVEMLAASDGFQGLLMQTTPAAQWFRNLIVFPKVTLSKLTMENLDTLHQCVQLQVKSVFTLHGILKDMDPPITEEGKELITNALITEERTNLWNLTGDNISIQLTHLRTEYTQFCDALQTYSNAISQNLWAREIMIEVCNLLDESRLAHSPGAFGLRQERLSNAIVTSFNGILSRDVELKDLIEPQGYLIQAWHEAYQYVKQEVEVVTSFFHGPMSGAGYTPSFSRTQSVILSQTKAGSLARTLSARGLPAGTLFNTKDLSRRRATTITGPSLDLSSSYAQMLKLVAPPAAAFIEEETDAASDNEVGFGSTASGTPVKIKGGCGSGGESDKDNESDHKGKSETGTLQEDATKMGPSGGGDEESKMDKSFSARGGAGGGSISSESEEKEVSRVLTLTEQDLNRFACLIRLVVITASQPDDRYLSAFSEEQMALISQLELTDLRNLVKNAQALVVTAKGDVQTIIQQGGITTVNVEGTTTVVTITVDKRDSRVNTVPLNAFRHEGAFISLEKVLNLSLVPFEIYHAMAARLEASDRGEVVARGFKLSFVEYQLGAQKVVAYFLRAMKKAREAYATERKTQSKVSRFDPATTDLYFLHEEIKDVEGNVSLSDEEQSIADGALQAAENGLKLNIEALSSAPDSLVKTVSEAINKVLVNIDAAGRRGVAWKMIVDELRKVIGIMLPVNSDRKEKMLRFLFNGADVKKNGRNVMLNVNRLNYLVKIVALEERSKAMQKAVGMCSVRRISRLSRVDEERPNHSGRRLTMGNGK